jgi:hypothetical protein
MVATLRRARRKGVRTTRHPGGRWRYAGAVAICAVLLGAAVPAAAAPPVGGCVAGDVGGQVRCENVLNNSLNNVSVHILSH